MSELQIGLLAIGALVVAGVLAYNKFQERRARGVAENAFASGHDDVLLARPEPAAVREEPTFESPVVAVPTPEEVPPLRSGEDEAPDPAIDYVIELEVPAGAPLSRARDAWQAIRRRHGARARLAARDASTWLAGLQLVSRDGALGEADLIEFRASVEALVLGIGGAVRAAPEMRAATQAARELDDFCAETDIQLVIHVVAASGTPFPGTKIRAAAEAHGLVLEPEGRFVLRNDEGQLLYTLGARDGAAFSPERMRETAPSALTLSIDLPRAPGPRRDFENLSRLAHQLCTALGGSIVDDNGHALDDRALEAIAQQLDAVRETMEARGIVPGGALALRLYA